MTWKKFVLTSILFLLVAFNADAQTVTGADTLKSKIDERNNQIKQLEEEIKQYNLEVDNANKQAKTLQNTIKTLDLTKKKITTDITLTEKKITNTSLTIEQIDSEIDTTLEKIDTNKIAISNAIKNAKYAEDTSVLALILSKKSLGDVWSEIDDASQIREAVREKTVELSALKKTMEEKQDVLKGQKSNLLSLKQDLSGKKQAVEYTVKEKATVLAETKNKEQAFKVLVKTKEQQKEQFERELFEYESQLRYLIDKDSYPRPKNGILSWPLDSVFINQKFGKTVGAEKLYTSGSHNGIDLKASVGTRVINVLTGNVVGTGNTDAYPGCYSFGKWVMVKHDNGLSTIYGHLSVISTQTGQRLNTGDLIGYSGNTGYSTGPHLHISIYATQGVRIEKYVNSRGCKEATLPLADIKAYLDPLDYFPSI
ncbi:MAG: Membrane-bound metallopeptidase [Parcubacteria group bacterium Gr01-1014_46]|nr:MAG: Membrane-bound metallopeptidase [Parcubacteria group bacterium Gr01-1014_46]